MLHELKRSLDALDAIADAATSPDRERIWQLKNRLRPIQSNSPSFQTQLLELVEQVELPDAAWLQTKFAELSMAETKSRIGSSSSTIKIRSAGMTDGLVYR